MSDNKRHATYTPNLGPNEKPKNPLSELQSGAPVRHPECIAADNFIAKDIRRFKNYVRGALIVAYFVLGGHGVIIWSLLQDR